MTTETRDQLLMKWADAKKALDAAKIVESEIRKQIVAESGLFDADKESGTQTVDLGGGYKLKAVKKINYKVDNKNGEAFEMLKSLSELGEVSAHKAKNLFRFDANLSLTKYRELDDKEQALVDQIVTTKPAMPSLELIEPKEVK